MLSDISIKNPVFGWMLLIGIIVFGGLSFMTLGVSQLPDVDAPVLSISASWENAAPEIIETTITDIIESTVIGIQGVTEINSSSRKGQAWITVTFDINKNIDVALQEVQSKLARAQHSLPEDMEPPTIMKSNPEDQPIVWITFSGKRGMKELMQFTQDYLKDQFSTIPGVGEVTLGGFAEPCLRVWLNSDKMLQNELTVDDVTAAIGSEHSEVPAGYIDTGTKELNIRVVGEAGSVEEFQSIIIPGRRGAPMWKKFRIKDVADVEDGMADLRHIARTMGEQSVGIGIRKQRGTNAVEVAKNVKKRIAEIKKFLPADTNLSIRFDTTKFVEESIKEMNFVLILSVVLTAFVCWLFLGSISSAVNIFLTIPMSIIGAFFVIKLFGFTLNTFTLLALSLVVGIVVDDAIMVLENITRHREAGEPRIRAAIKGAREISFAAIAATLSILAIFIPVIFMKGVIGKNFFQFGVTISSAVMISLLGALTLTPMYSAQFLTVGHTTGIGRLMDRIMAVLRKVYTSLLGQCLRHRWRVIFVAVVFFTGSLFLFNLVKKEFAPAQDQSMLNVRIQTDIGTSLEITDKVFAAAELAVMQIPESQTYFSNFGGSDSNSGNISLTLKKPKTRPINKKKNRVLTQQEIIPMVREKIKAVPGVRRVTVQDPSLLSFGSQRGFPVEFTLRGRDWAKLAELSKEMAKQMDASGVMTDVDSDYRIGVPELAVLPDRNKAAERGVSISTIGNTINALIAGVRAGKYTAGGRRYDIRVQLVSSDRKQVKDISRIWVRNNRGETVRLSDVVSIGQQPSMLSIMRQNRERAIRVFGNIAQGKSQGEALQKVEEIAKKVLPEGYKIVFSGSSKTFKESFNSLYVALILGIFVAYMILGVQFNSFIHPFTVLLALPFSISGAVIALLLTHNSLNIYSAIGIILLMGIVKKNSILLVDFTNQLREKGENVNDALMKACPIRLRPIIMTSFSTIAGAIPSALALGPGAESRIPMAVVIIGGVLFSTLLTLFVVPCAYSLLSRLESRAHQQEVHEAIKELGQ
ncbi:MAG: efflux RND transporter permease subunit [Elusimicrobiota bacterium]